MEKRAQGMSLQQRKDNLPEILRRFEQENMQKVAAEKNRCHFHLMAPVGWLNDPNGLSYFPVQPLYGRTRCICFIPEMWRKREIMIISIPAVERM